MSDSLFISIMTLVLFAVGLVLTPVACTDTVSARKTLDSSGFTNETFQGYSWFACSEDDSFTTKFRATNPKGERVQGVVCCGLMKACTVRFF